MKTCTKCGFDKNESEFHRKTKKRLHSICKDCKKDYDRGWYKTNERRRNLLRKRAEERRIRNIKFIREYKLSKGCKRCGYNNSYFALEFHHRDEDKKYTISKMNTLSLETIKKEIEKCDVLCSNCHREHHAKEI